MARYIIRKLHLITRQMMAKELGVRDSIKLDNFERLYRQHPFVLKVIVKRGEISRGLLSVFSLRGFPCWIRDEGRFYLFGSEPAFREWSRLQSYALSEEEIFIEALRQFLIRQARTQFEMVHEQYILNFGGPTRIMGILNTTPDSFFDGGRYADPKAAIERGLALEADGADMIDVGGESTRPGAEPVSEADEMARVVPVIEGLARDLQIPISVDTYKAAVAEAAIQAGATMVNDVSALQMDPHMAEVVAHYQVPVILMHMKGRPRDMQKNPTYDDLMDELILFFEERLQYAESVGIRSDRIIVDPGIGFGKRLWDNYEILQRLPEFRCLGCPILVGPSRKSFIGQVLNLKPDERLEGTAAAVAACAALGAEIVRVHDVKEMLRVVQIADLIFGNLDFHEQDTKP